MWPFAVVLSWGLGVILRLLCCQLRLLLVGGLKFAFVVSWGAKKLAFVVLPFAFVVSGWVLFCVGG